MAIKKSARGLVLAYLNALNDENFPLAKQYVSEDFSFDGVLGSRKGSDSYMSDMEKMRLKYDVKKAFADGNDVCVWYDVTMSGTTVPTAGWYHVKSGRITTLKVVFDPRPVLAGKAA
jgi:hypothetical protein